MNLLSIRVFQQSQLRSSVMCTSIRQLSSGNEVLFRVSNNKGIITLNRPKALNALNLSMAKQILSQLRLWQTENLSQVLIESTGGKAFCAGGDIRAVTSSANKGSVEQAEFFLEEYKLNNLIGTLKVPYIAFIDGITMGGGVGLSVHGKFRIATERTLFAMPETGIGLYPDVGGSYFLPRLSGELGTFLALTGHRLKGYDTLKSGIATHVCKTEQLENLKTDLIQLPESCSVNEILSVLDAYTEKFPEKKPFSLEGRLGLINECFSPNSVEEIIDKLRTVSGSEDEKKWGHDLAEHILKMAPSSLKVTLKQVREGKKLKTLAQCLQMEYRLSRRFCQNPDFYEGVRAVLEDRDGNPHWNPDTLEKVTSEMVNSYFDQLPADEELQL